MSKINLDSICEKIFFINMESSKLRREQSFKNLGNLNLDIERVNAVTPENFKEESIKLGINLNFNDIPNNNTKEIYTVHTKRSPRWRGDICCGLSHVKAIEKALEQNLRKVMICEDDFVYLQDDSLKFQKNIDDIPKDFDVIHITSLLHGNYNNAFKNNKFIDYKVKGKFINETVFQVKYGLLGTGAYIINLENKKFIDEYFSILKSGGISDCLMAFRMQSKYIHYTTKYKLGYQDYQLPTTIARKKGEEVDILSPRIKWLKNVTFNTPWSILEQKSKNKVEIVKKYLENTPNEIKICKKL